jgi:hypothetical protein
VWHGFIAPSALAAPSGESRSQARAAAGPDPRSYRTILIQMNMKRMRGRGFRQGGGGGGPFRHSGGGGGGGNQQPMNRNHVFDSSGPDVRVRGTAQQLFEKYLQLGRDATSAGDRVMAEAYFQYAEHYFRVLGAMNQAQAQQPGPPQGMQQQGPQQGGHPRGPRHVPIDGGDEPMGEATVIVEEPVNLTAELEAELAAENPNDPTVQPPAQR